MSELRRAVFMDRDGVLNEVVMRGGQPASPRRVAELVIPLEAHALVYALRQAGFLVFVATNQPDVARRKMSVREHKSIMGSLRDTLQLDDARSCLHDDADACECRKPKPGMLLDLAAEWRVDLPASFMLGDSAKDVAAGRAAGCRTVLLRTPHNEGVEADFSVDSLDEAARLIVGAKPPATALA